MGQLSQFLRNTEDGVAHYCVACKGMHNFSVKRPNYLSQRWTWNENIIAPTFFPSMHIVVRDMRKPKFMQSCHYWLRSGRVEFLRDSTHSMAGITISLPVLPEYLRDRVPCP